MHPTSTPSRPSCSSAAGKATPNVIDLAAFRRHGKIAPLASPSDRPRSAAERKAVAIQTAMTALEAALEELLVASDALAHAGDLRFRSVDKISERVAEQLHATMSMMTEGRGEPRN